MQEEALGGAPFVVTQMRIERALGQYSSFIKPWSATSLQSALSDSQLHKRRCTPTPSERGKNQPAKKKKSSGTGGPLDYEGFLERVRTFKISTWCADSSEISPLECARHGWINTGYDVLTCQACGSMLALKLPPMLFEDEGMVTVASKHLTCNLNRVLASAKSRAQICGRSATSAQTCVPVAGYSLSSFLFATSLSWM